MSFKSSSIWHDIKHVYDVVLENTFWTLGKSDCINLWNNRWCSNICLPELARIPYFDRARLYSVVSSVWTSTHWNFPSFIDNLYANFLF